MKNNSVSKRIISFGLSVLLCFGIAHPLYCFSFSDLFKNTNYARFATVAAVTTTVIATCYIAYKMLFHHKETPPITPPVNLKPSQKPIIRQISVHKQAEAASCSYHALNNAMLLQDIHTQATSALSLEHAGAQKNFDLLFERGKRQIISIRKKAALLDYIKKTLLNSLEQKNNSTYKKIIQQYADSICDEAFEQIVRLSQPYLLTNEKFTSDFCKKLDELHASTEPRIILQNIPTFYEIALQISQEDLISAFYLKYAQPIIASNHLVLTQMQEMNLAQFLMNEEVEKQIDEIKRVVRSNDFTSYQTTLYGSEENLNRINERLKTYLLQKVPQLNSLLPDNIELYNLLIAQPELFSDIYGQWIDIDEMKQIISACVDEKYRKNITILNSADELTLYPEILVALKKEWQSNQGMYHAFVIFVDADQVINARGHWITIAFSQRDGQKYIYCTDSLGKDRRQSTELTTLLSLLNS